jgi:hypothetical protein
MPDKLSPDDVRQMKLTFNLIANLCALVAVVLFTGGGLSLIWSQDWASLPLKILGTGVISFLLSGVFILLKNSTVNPNA